MCRQSGARRHSESCCESSLVAIGYRSYEGTSDEHKRFDRLLRRRKCFASEFLEVWTSAAVDLATRSDQSLTHAELPVSFLLFSYFFFLTGTVWHRVSFPAASTDAAL